MRLQAKRMLKRELLLLRWARRTPTPGFCSCRKRWLPQGRRLHFLLRRKLPLLLLLP